MFILKGYLTKFQPLANTQHVTQRCERLQIANRLIQSENAKVITIAIVDKGHINGDEVHVIYNNGVVKIYNAITSKFITVLIARIPQIERYNIQITATMRKKVNEHIKQGYNNI